MVCPECSGEGGRRKSNGRGEGSSWVNCLWCKGKKQLLPSDYYPRKQREAEAREEFDDATIASSGATAAREVAEAALETAKATELAAKTRLETARKALMQVF